MTGATTSSGRRRDSAKALTLLELLVSVAILAALVALLLPGVSRAQQRTRTVSCNNRLRQIGVSMAMYLSDGERYPPLWDERTSEICFAKLRPYNLLEWTNIGFHCPEYIRRQGEVYENHDGNSASSYSYNWHGTVGWPGCPKELYQLNLGLGHLSKDAAHEPEVRAPSEMYVIADARPYSITDGICGNPKMTLYAFSGLTEINPPHRHAYNILFGEGHVTATPRSVYLFPPKSAAHWNRDNEPHPETWAPMSSWVVRK